MSFRGTRHYLALAMLLASIAGLAQAETPKAVVIDVGQADFSEIARSVRKGSLLRIQRLQLEQEGVTNLDLERFDVFAPGAKIIVDGIRSVPPPRDAYFRGTASSIRGSMVVLTVPTDGPVHGVIRSRDSAWILSEPEDSLGGLSSRKVDPHSEFSHRPFKCGVEGLTPPDLHQEQESTPSRPALGPAASDLQYTAQVIVDTDFEYYAKFNNEQAALAYMGDLFAFVSATYEQEVNTSLLIASTRLFTANNDPYVSNSCCPGALDELRLEWSPSSENRTIVHLLSGKSAGCGCAWIGALCSTTYGYGVSLGLDANFDGNNPQVLWDSIVVAHEIGHNFNSPHTHDYCNIDGESNPVDLCVDSDLCGLAFGLPGLDSLAGGTSGQGNGTIMSYCHLLSGGFGNMTFTLGLNHPYGVAPDRVPDHMYDHVVSRAISNPGCFTAVDPCDSDGDGDYDRDDTRSFISQCLGGLAPLSECDLDGNGEFRRRDVILKVRGCRTGVDESTADETALEATRRL